MNIHGIKSCDTCRKAIKAFETQGKSANFIDFRVDGLMETDLDRWLEAVGWEALLNRRSTSWRALDEADKAKPDAAKARALMLANPILIKRPVFDDGSRILIGFGKAQQLELLG